MKITFVGGALEIGGSCILLKADGKNILLDCGLRQGGDKDPLPDFRSIQDAGGVDLIIISHAHIDHTGTLPVISREYPGAPIYMTQMTRDLARVLLADSIKIMNFREGEIPFYNADDVEGMFSRVIPLNYEVELTLWEGASLCFYNAGHIAGAACIYLKTGEGSLFYSGDFSLFSQKTVNGLRIPKLNPDVAIIESTYGDKLHSNRELEEKRLIDLVSELDPEGGKILIPAFALGRAQEVILILKKAFNQRKLRDIPVYVDGMIKNINAVYMQNPLYLKAGLANRIFRGTHPFYDKNIRPVESQEERIQIASSKESCIIVASSGMLQGGPSQFFAGKLTPQENAMILITGYQDEEAPGRKLLNLMEKSEEEKRLDIENGWVPVRCQINRIGLSAHGDKSEIRNLVATLSPKNLFFVHGDPEIVRALSLEVSAEFKGNVFVPGCGETFSLDSGPKREQISKSFPTIQGVEEELSETAMEGFWSFMSQNYSHKLLTIEDLLFIRHGKTIINEEIIRKTRDLLLNSLFFQNDPKRLFLFKARGPLDVAARLKEGKKVLNQQEIITLAEDIFRPLGCKKVSLMLPEQKIILNFDFPLVLPPALEKHKALFLDQVKDYEIEVNTGTNIQAVEILARELLKGSTIKKFSHFLEERKIQAILTGEYKSTDEPARFREKTGLTLEIIKTKASPPENKTSQRLIAPGKGKAEQNAALQYINSAFADKESQPYKLGIKSGPEGKYIELSFISPKVGSRYQELIQELSHKIGWTLEISRSVNQNEIINIAKRICDEYGFQLKKNPSYNPVNMMVTLKTEEGKLPPQGIEAFEQQTGCKLEIQKG